MIRIAALLLFFLTSALGVATTTTLAYTLNPSKVNANVQFATNATENIVVVQVSPGHPVTVEFNDSAAWSYRTTTADSTADSTTDKPVAASQALKLRFTQTTTFYTVRATADGTCVATLLLQE